MGITTCLSLYAVYVWSKCTKNTHLHIILSNSIPVLNNILLSYEYLLKLKEGLDDIRSPEIMLERDHFPAAIWINPLLEWGVLQREGRLGLHDGVLAQW